VGADDLRLVEFEGEWFPLMRVRLEGAGEDCWVSAFHAHSALLLGAPLNGQSFPVFLMYSDVARAFTNRHWRWCSAGGEPVEWEEGEPALAAQTLQDAVEAMRSHPRFVPGSLRLNRVPVETLLALAGERLSAHAGERRRVRVTVERRVVNSRVAVIDVPADWDEERIGRSVGARASELFGWDADEGAIVEVTRIDTPACRPTDVRWVVDEAGARKPTEPIMPAGDHLAEIDGVRWATDGRMLWSPDRLPQGGGRYDWLAWTQEMIEVARPLLGAMKTTRLRPEGEADGVRIFRRRGKYTGIAEVYLSCFPEDVELRQGPAATDPVHVCRGGQLVGLIMPVVLQGPAGGHVAEQG